jgi:hypothetical protein
MKFGKARCELRNPGPGVEHRELPCYTGIDNEKAIANSINRGGPTVSRRDLARIWQTLQLPS